MPKNYQRCRITDSLCPSGGNDTVLYYWEKYFAIEGRLQIKYDCLVSREFWNLYRKDSLDSGPGWFFVRWVPWLTISNCTKITAYTHPQIDLIDSKEIAISYLSFHPYCSLWHLHCLQHGEEDHKGECKKLDTTLKQQTVACVSSFSIIFSSRLNNFKHTLSILFLKFASNVSHLAELMCFTFFSLL